MIKDIKIWADFNAIEQDDKDCKKLILPLTSYGTLADLSKRRIMLRDLKYINLFDSDGLRLKGTLFFDSLKLSSNNLGWYVKFMKDDLVSIDESSFSHNKHLCFNCRRDIKGYLLTTGQEYKENCPFCNCSILTPFLPPHSY